MRYTQERPDVESLCDLREAVEWERAEEDYPAAFDGYAETAAAYDGDRLVGWCALASDGVRHGFLIDVMVHPDYQRRGIGHTVVSRVIDQLRQRGVTIIHADFSVEHAKFYSSLEFQRTMAGVRYL